MEGREKKEEDVEGDEVMMEKVYVWWKEGWTTYHPLVWSMPSAMKSAGKVDSNNFLFSKG